MTDAMAARADVAPVAAVAETARVPWLSLVLPLGLTLSLADDFWVISLRTSVGAIERTDEPFVSWLRESAIFLPLFVLALVAALAVARHWLGDRPRGFRPVFATLLLVVAAGTAVGIVGLAASAAYDYHLQVIGLVHHSETHGDCLGECLAGREQASFDLQVRAVAYGSAILLATNLLLVGWVVALRGGRLEPSARRRATDDAGLARRRTLPDDVAWALAAALVGAAAVHAAVIPEHLAKRPAAGGFFVLLSCAGLLAAVLVLLHRGRRVLLLVGAVTVGPLVVWAWSRSLGLPFGPEPGVREPVGLADIAAGVLELTALVLVLVLAGHGGRRGARPTERAALSAHARGIALAAVVAVAALGVGGSGVAGLGIVVDTPDHNEQVSLFDAFG